MVSLTLQSDLENPFPSPSLLAKELPLSANDAAFLTQSRQTVLNILEGKDPRLLLIVGPCSIHDAPSALEYGTKLGALAQELKEHFFIVMRAYFEKPRTVYGWKGFLYDPYLDGTHDVLNGLYLTRELLVNLTRQQIPIASELLELITAPYFSDLLTWGCIGARTSNSPPHRQLAATLPFPIGFKNTTCGSLQNATNACLSASSPHAFLGLTPLGELGRVFGPGNPCPHIILRGSEKGPNYDICSINHALALLKKADLPPRVLVDCSHDNCKKIPQEQRPVFESLIDQVALGNRSIKGIMLESHLFEGRQQIPQNLSTLKHGVSITDPCLSFNATADLLLSGANHLKKHTLQLA